MQKILLVVGARPNFVKAAPLFNELKNKSKINPLILHTGQHYDYEMSQIFFEDLNLPDPHFHLNIGPGSHATQTAGIMIGTETILIAEKPVLVVVFGDVNSTVAAALTARKLHIPVAHVEAGLRSFDKTMPEEINRKMTDAISDLLFTHCADAEQNLKNEGVAKTNIFPVGNIMIDSLRKVASAIDDDFEDALLASFSLQKKRYILATLHRPSNVDSPPRLKKIMDQLKDASRILPCIIPLHPRTLDRLEKMNISACTDGRLIFTGPKSYKEFVALEKNAAIVVTDSGGVQEETTYLKVPCLTVRPNTERPVTVTMGTNKLVEPENIKLEIARLANAGTPEEINSRYPAPPLWDGFTAGRISETLLSCAIG